MSNARRHAQPGVIRVLLQPDERVVRLEVRDDGVGIASDAARASGMGLRIMQFRARTMGGELSIEPGERGGTVVTFEGPQPAVAERQSRSGVG